ncbi:NAD(P)-binding protein [Polyplosphaeria fusca]|uniref:NAD(P)-binding protein n=1 Tax=Polyplosphaeria fusca TaxID=682080 RepID=A0A9P4V048_9PLEO|nr:NAD(P)-binding protein [Polyplosphaeria fusca]
MASGKGIILITGGNTGIGYETVKALMQSEKPYTILMGSRKLENADNAIKQLSSEVPNTRSDVTPIQIDIVDDDSIDKCFKAVEQKYGKLDVLINNAGAAHDGLMLQTPGAKGIRAAWDLSYSVNVTSTQVMTSVFMPLLLQSSDPRLLFITSGLSSLNTASSGKTSNAVRANPPKGWPKPSEMSAIAYRSSKTALNMMMLDWARVLKEDGVKVWAISPGFLATGLAGVGAEKLKSFGAGHPSAGGDIIKKVVEGERDGDVGQVVNKDGVQPW